MPCPYTASAYGHVRWTVRRPVRHSGCVEAAVTEHAVRVRDAEDVTRAGLAVGRDGWARSVRHTARRER
ncbi:hypothetical protein GCM10018772_38670 [Streptomyces fumanus]|uniref:DUF397 domain-containing protein n=1 Tax=Streptomyces fumanus TaxID=67302 RepID=A0A919AHL8_9ACTN|nr:hypothetical protein GCM10018772_38670 [Streptomyces fumanus]